MPRSLLCLPLLSALAFVHCGLTEAPAPSAPPAANRDVPDAQSPDAPSFRSADTWWVVARRDNSLRLTSVALHDGSEGHLSWELPHRADAVRSAEVWGLGVVRFELQDGRTTLEAEGSQWTTLATSDAGQPLITRVSPSGQLAFVEHRASPGAEVFRTQIIGVEDWSVGDSSEHGAKAHDLYDSETSGSRLEFLAFGSSSIFVQDGRAVRMAEPTSGLRTIAEVDSSPAAVQAIFQSSVLLRDRFPVLKWVDVRRGEERPMPAGVPITQENTQGRWVLAGRELFELRDAPERSAVLLQSAPQLQSPSQLVTVRPSPSSPLALVHDVAWRFIGAQGTELARYEPAPAPTICESGAMAGASTYATVRNLYGNPVVLVRVTHQCTSGDSIQGNGSSLDAWRFNEKNGKSLVKRLASFAEGAKKPRFELSSSGAFAVAVVDGKLNRIDTTTGERTTLDIGAVLLDWPVHDNE